MISLSPVSNRSVSFGAKQNTSEPKEEQRNSNIGSKLTIPTLAMLMYLCPMSSRPATMDYTEATANNIELVDSTAGKDVEAPRLTNIYDQWDKTQLKPKDLADAPSPKITVKGKEINAGIVVDRATNRLYRYDEDGNVFDGYRVATGVIGKNKQSITDPGIRYIDHLEEFPYSKYPGTKRAKYPKDYGPKILHLVMVDSQKGILKDKNGRYIENGEYIHGNNNAASIGKYASHGCIRMGNDVIEMMYNETPVGTYVLIK